MKAVLFLLPLCLSLLGSGCDALSYLAKYQRSYSVEVINREGNGIKAAATFTPPKAEK